MSTPVPTEIFLNIFSKVEHETLLSVRLASKALSEVAAVFLFEELSLHYGFERSWIQMKAVASSPMRRHIKSLFLPSESFMPLKVVENRTTDFIVTPWHRPVPVGYSRSRTLIESLSGPMPWEDFDIVSQSQLYTEALIDLLENCLNLKSVHIASSNAIGYYDRWKFWHLMFSKNIFPKIAQLGVSRLKISLLLLKHAVPLLSGYGGPREPAVQKLVGQPTVFTNIKTISMVVDRPGQSTGPQEAEAIHRIDGFFSSIPNLRGYEISHNILRPADEPLLLPPQTVRPQLKHLLLDYVSLTDERLREFKEMITSVPLLTSLELRNISIDLPLKTEDFSFTDHTPMAFGKFFKIITGLFADLPETNWGGIFETLLERLPHLDRFTFRRILYSIGDTEIIPGVGILPPNDGKHETGDLGAIRSVLETEELISLYESDYVKLEVFRRTLRERSRGARLRSVFLQN